MSRRFSRRKKNLPQDPIQLSVERLSHEGRGIASNNGKIAFVDNGLPGETVIARYINSKSRFDELAVESVIEASVDRIIPQCQYFGTCGGCSLQHMSSAAQIEFKQQLLIEQLCHATGLNEADFSVLPILQAQPYHYRRKARLAVRFVAKKGGTLIGFREKNSSFITQMDSCQVLEKPLSNLLKPLADLINKMDAKFAIPQIEAAVGEHGSAGHQVALVVRHLELLTDSDLQLLKQFAHEHAIEMYLQPKGAETIHQIWPQNAQQRLTYQLPEYGIEYRFHPSDFIQVNAEINRLIIKRALDLLELSPDDVVLDLFCGLGNFTLPMAKASKQAIGIEGSETMVERANENAQHNNISNAEFHFANLYESISDQPWSKQPVDKVLLDPPRSGALEIIDHLANLKAQKIVYISCNPATLTRDATKLLDKGYKLTKAGVIDMFPHTAHVESMAEFVLDSNLKD